MADELAETVVCDVCDGKGRHHHGAECAVCKGEGKLPRIVPADIYGAVMDNPNADTRDD